MLNHSDACERNKQPILDILRNLFAEARLVLEIGSGTGQHAVYFAQQLPQLIWQPSDCVENIVGIRARLELEGPSNCNQPLLLDVSHKPWPPIPADAIFSANTLHIMNWQQVCDFFTGAGQILDTDGILCIYGPFKYKGQYTSASNNQFDQWLQQRDPNSGLRDFESVNELAEKAGFRCSDDYAMPANNQMVIWKKCRYSEST